MAPNSKFVSRSEKEGIKHSPSTQGLCHRTPCQPWHSLSCLRAVSTFRYLRGAAVLRGALAQCPQLPLPIHGLFILCLARLLHVTSCYLPLVSTITFSPLVLPYLERTSGLH